MRDLSPSITDVATSSASRRRDSRENFGRETLSPVRSRLTLARPANVPRNNQVRRSVLVTLAIAAIACGPIGRPGAQSGETSGPLSVRIVGAGNGSLNVVTAPDAGCTAQAHLRSGDPAFVPSPTHDAD